MLRVDDDRFEIAVPVPAHSYLAAVGRLGDGQVESMPEPSLTSLRRRSIARPRHRFDDLTYFRYINLSARSFSRSEASQRPGPYIELNNQPLGCSAAARWKKIPLTPAIKGLRSPMWWVVRYMVALSPSGLGVVLCVRGVWLRSSQPPRACVYACSSGVWAGRVCVTPSPVCV